MVYIVVLLYYESHLLRNACIVMIIVISALINCQQRCTFHNQPGTALVANIIVVFICKT